MPVLCLGADFLPVASTANTGTLNLRVTSQQKAGVSSVAQHQWSGTVVPA